MKGSRQQQVLTNIWQSVRVDTDAIHAELLRRAWTIDAWATVADVDPGTATAFLRGQNVRPVKARQLIEALGLNWTQIIHAKTLKDAAK